MNQILNKLREVDPNNGEAIKEALSQFFQHLSKHTEADCGQWLRALECAINRFPKYCMSQRGTAENYLATFLDCTNYFIVIEAAKCAHCLQQVKPTQEKTATPKTCWRDLMSSLCSAAHRLIGALFPNAVDIYEQKAENEQDTSSLLAAALSRLSNTRGCSAVNRQTLIHTRLRNVFVFIQAMLVEMYPVAKPICPQTILDVIVRALSVSSAPAQNLADAAMIKTQALRCLDALVGCLGSNLIPYSALVFRFVMQTLKWSSENPSNESRKVRCIAYASLTRWLSTLHTHKLGQNRGTSWEDDLTEHIVGDITPHRHVVELKVNSQPMKNLSKKARRKMANTMLQESSIAAHIPGEKNKVSVSEEVNDEVAIAALECAEVFLTVCGIFLKPATHKRFQERLVRECHALITYSSSRALALLRTLESARKGGPPTLPPPTQYCLQLYSVHLNSPHRQIATFCSQALLDIRLHLHCSPPSLTFAIQPPPDETRTEPKNQVSERNREALENLLGPDKVPKQTNQQAEIITIPDEPSSKRRKVDADGDKISVSSTDSIEISDDSNQEDVELVVDTNSVVEEMNDEMNEELNDEMNEELNDELNEESNDDPMIEETKRIKDIENIDCIYERQPQNSIEDTDYTKETQINQTEISDDQVDSTQNEPRSIYEASTQMPLNVSNEEEEETPLSMEVAYDYPNTGAEKVSVLEKLEGDNLPSTNETDDIEITCGQDVQTPLEKKCEEKVVEVKVNGVEHLPEKPLQNGDVSEGAGNGKDLNVDDMLADFVDEVNEDSQVTQATTA